MAAFEITYYDLKNEQEHKHEITYDGPEVSESDTWRIGLERAMEYCNENNVCFIGITNICM